MVYTFANLLHKAKPFFWGGGGGVATIEATEVTSVKISFVAEIQLVTQ